jgi:serine/alanine adding enzyme
LLAGAFVIYMGDKAWYKDGGSFTVKRELMAPYSLQWEIMRWLKARGVASYDLVAVPPADQLNDKHPFWGLYRFKSGFNSEITEFIGAWDFPLRSWQYRLWRSGGERLAFELVKAWQHDLLY